MNARWYRELHADNGMDTRFLWDENNYPIIFLEDKLDDFGLVLPEGFSRETALAEYGEWRVRTIGTYILIARRVQPGDDICLGRCM